MLARSCVRVSSTVVTDASVTMVYQEVLPVAVSRVFLLLSTTSRYIDGMYCALKVGGLRRVKRARGHKKMLVLVAAGRDFCALRTQDRKTHPFKDHINVATFHGVYYLNREKVQSRVSSETRVICPLFDFQGSFG